MKKIKNNKKVTHTYNVMGDVFMFNDKSPLMFINSVQTDNKLKNGQEMFDSRYPKAKKVEQKKEIVLDEVSLKRLENLVILYKQNRSALCSFVCNNKVIEGIPINYNNEVVSILIDNIIEEVSIYDINDYIILDF